MKLFFRYFFPISYFQSTRLNRWDLVAYNGLVEWLPALLLALFYNNFSLLTIGNVLLSYLAFICVYEIGYIVNDAYSERFEEDPRGRSERFDEIRWTIWALIGIRLLFWTLITYFLTGFSNIIWIIFHVSLLITFLLHNSVRNEYRTATFFGLSTFRYFAPMILVVPYSALTILFPAVLLNNSLYRTTVYVRNKNSGQTSTPSAKGKLTFYLACLPLSIFFSVFFLSPLPTMVCLYFMAVWIFYWALSKVLKHGSAS